MSIINKPLFSKFKDISDFQARMEELMPVEGDGNYLKLISFLEPYIPSDLKDYYNELKVLSNAYEKNGVLENKEYEQKRDFLFNRLGFGAGYSEIYETNWYEFSDNMNLTSKGILIPNYTFNSTCDEERRIENITLASLDEETIEEIEIKEYIEQANILPEGWFWCKYSDGSGSLYSPTGENYMFYDLYTNEYKATQNSNYEFFPLSYYYVDGIEPSKFKPFDYMEQEMIEILEKQKYKTEVELN